MSKNYSALLFDWDGCLVKSLDSALETYQEVFSRFHISLSDEQITTQVFGDWNAPVQFGVPESELGQFDEQYRTLFREKLETVEMYTHAYETVQHFFVQGKKLALLTSSERATITPALEGYGFDTLFNVVLTAEDVEHHKPHPEIVHLALKKLSASKEETVMIGDSKSDLGAAQNAGVDSLLFYPPTHQKFYTLDYLQTYQPTYWVDSLEKIKTIVE